MNQDMPLKRRFELSEDILQEMEELSFHDSNISYLYHALSTFPQFSAGLILWIFARTLANTVNMIQKQLLEKFNADPGKPIICLCSECGKIITLKPKEYNPQSKGG